MSDGDFKQMFNKRLKELIDIKDAIEANIRNKQQFSIEIIQRLTAINERVKELGNYIRLLKKQIPNLQIQSNKNDNQIDDKSREINELKNEINQLKSDAESKTNESYRLSQVEISKVKGLQAKIDDLTNQYNDLKKKQDSTLKRYEDLKKQQEAMSKQQQITNDTRIQIREKETAEKNVLNDRIKALEAELVEKTNNATQLQSQIQSQIDDSQKLIAEREGRINELITEITQLKKENEELRIIIINATKTINDVVEVLKILKERRSFEPGELEEKITAIEESIREIYTTSPNIRTNSDKSTVFSFMKGPAGLPPPPSSQVYKNNTRTPRESVLPEESVLLPPLPPPNTPRILETNTPRILETNTPRILPSISEEGKEGEDLEGIDLDFSGNPNETSTNESIGGKKTKKNRKLKRSNKTKKNRKQKGGYIYKSNSKRRNIRTTTSRKTPTTSSRKTSARGRLVNKRR
jgi:hypothetical protein